MDVLCADAVSMPELDGHGRGLKQAIGKDATEDFAAACNINTSDGTQHFVCLTGVAAGKCRSQSQGAFGNDCALSCLI